MFLGLNVLNALVNISNGQIQSNSSQRPELPPENVSASNAHLPHQTQSDPSTPPISQTPELPPEDAKKVISQPAIKIAFSKKEQGTPIANGLGFLERSCSAISALPSQDRAFAVILRIPALSI